MRASWRGWRPLRRIAARRAEPTAHVQTRSLRLDRLWWVGVSILGIQGAAMLVWSTVLWSRFALTWDYSILFQPMWLIAHGHLNPYSTLLGVPFWRNQLDLLPWLLAPLALIVLHGPVLLWLQDCCLVGAEVVAWRWMTTVTTARPLRHARFLRVVGLVLLIANPWAWEAISFDFHIQVVAVLFALLAAYDMVHARHRTWLWVGVMLLCGIVIATWVAGLGLAVLLAVRNARRRGLILFGVGIGWVAMLSFIHADLEGSLIGNYAYLVGPRASAPASLATLIAQVAFHPGGAFFAIWSHRVDIWANLAPSGLIGIASPWTFGLALPVLLADDLARGTGFAEPLFQSVLLYVMVPLGTVLVLVRINGRWPRPALGLGAVAVANAIAWSVIWGPQIPTDWLRVPPKSATVLGRAEAMIPPTAEVIASQGVVGRFSGRSLIYGLATLSPIPILGRDTWWVVAPPVGIETVPAINQDALIAQLAGPLHATLVLHGHGVWVFHWIPSPDTHSIAIPSVVTTMGAWMLTGQAGAPVVSGRRASWHLEGTGRAGYVLGQDYWREPPGRYHVSVRLASTVPVNVEVWNATGDVLLARRAVPATDGPETIAMLVDAGHAYPEYLFQGWGPFQARFVRPPVGNRLEVRVWSPGHGSVAVEEVALRRVRALGRRVATAGG